MTTSELITRLQIVADMGDKQIETLANLLIDYYSDKDRTTTGFKKETK